MVELLDEYRSEGLVAVEVGLVGDALTQFESALKLHGETGDSIELVRDLLLVGQAQFLIGEIGREVAMQVRARVTLQRALVVARQIAPRSAETWLALNVLAEIQAHFDPDAAIQLRQQASDMDLPNASGLVERFYIIPIYRQSKTAAGLRNRVQQRQTGPDSSTPPKPAPRPQEAIDWVDEAIDSLTPGQVLFNPSSEMQVGVTQPVYGRIANSVKVNLSFGLRGHGVPIVELVRVGPLMRMALTGDAFQIKPQSEPLQIVENGEFTEWRWDVTPQRDGRQTLTVRATVVLVYPGYPEHVKDLRVLDREVVVRVNRSYSVKRFVGEHWQWFVGTSIGLVGALGAIIGLLLRLGQGK